MMALRGHVGGSVLTLLLILVCTGGCTTLPPASDFPASSAYRGGAATTLEQLLAPAAAAQPGRSGFLILDTGREALTQRIALTELAEHALDLQYYIWNSDHSGRLLAQALLNAAERGVKVRLLLDDFNVGDRDQALLALDAHPNIELRVYNPFAQGARGGAGRWLDFIGDFSRLNRRMHNKTFVADASVAIVGGRNIGDEYFDLAEELNFRDRDLLATGPIVARVSANFDAYWNSDHAYPITALADAPAEDTLQTLSRQLEQQIAAAPPLPYPLPENAKAARAVMDNTLAQLVWAEAEMVFDQPDKPDDPQTVSANDHVGRKLLELAGGVRHELLIESAYLVLAEPANDLIGGLKQRGASVRALTNSLASNDVVPNHAAYIRARQGILQSGAELYELRPDAASCLQLIGSAERCNEDTVFSLHAKSVVFDREILYVGSFNLNQRSVYLNSETALIVHSPQLAQQVAATIEQNMQPQNSWQVVLDEQGRTVWITQQDGHEVRSYQEPAQSGWKRFKADFIALFPLEKYL